MCVLIADSGSTKTDWTLLDGVRVITRLQTRGINPFHQTADDIHTVLLSLTSQFSFSDYQLSIYFYGSGVRPELEEPMCRLLSEAIPSAIHVEAHSDLLGAAVALCGHEAGVACILGTGANSALYDGQRITQNTPPLGYILGDEGSGAVLGIRVLNALLKGRLPASMREAFFSQMQMTEADVIARVYRQPLANRWLASLSPFIHDHLGDPGVRDIVVGNFRDFFCRNVVPYGRRDLPVSAVGSVAWYYRDELAEAARLEGFTLGRIERAPMDALIEHFQA